MFILPLGLGLHIVLMSDIFHPVGCLSQMWVMEVRSAKKRLCSSVELSPLPPDSTVRVNAKSSGMDKGPKSLYSFLPGQEISSVSGLGPLYPRFLWGNFGVCGPLSFL